MVIGQPQMGKTSFAAQTTLISIRSSSTMSSQCLKTSTNINRNKMKTKIEKWAEETYIEYETLTTQYDLGFYSQSPLDEITSPIKVVVMGINPGSGGSFTAMRENSNWALNSLEQPFEHLIRGNADWENHTKWRYWQNMMSLLSETFPSIRENEPQECVFTNATFFNTPKATEVFEDLYDKTLPHTLRLIEILSPEIVVSLSPDNFTRMMRAMGADFKVVNVFGRRLMLGKYKDILFVSIYHPASRYSNAYKRLVQKSLKLIRVNRDLGIDDLAARLKSSLNKEWLDVNAPVAPRNSGLKQLSLECLALLHKRYPDANLQKDTLTINLNGHIYVKIVSQSSKQYVYFRHTNWNGKMQYYSTNPSLAETYPHFREVIDLLAEKGYTSTPTSLGEKFIAEYKLSNPQELAEAVYHEIQNIAIHLKEIFK